MQGSSDQSADGVWVNCTGLFAILPLCHFVFLSLCLFVFCMYFAEHWISQTSWLMGCVWIAFAFLPFCLFVILSFFPFVFVSFRLCTWKALNFPYQLANGVWVNCTGKSDGCRILYRSDGSQYQHDDTKNTRFVSDIAYCISRSEHRMSHVAFYMACFILYKLDRYQYQSDVDSPKYPWFPSTLDGRKWEGLLPLCIQSVPVWPYLICWNNASVRSKLWAVHPNPFSVSPSAALRGEGGIDVQQYGWD